eukprot:g19787.t1
MKALITEWLEEKDERFPHILRWSFHEAGTWDVREQNGAVFSSMPLKMMAFNPKQGYAARLPPPTLFWDGIVENMGAKMGLSVVDIVALMGGHTFGEMGNHGGSYNGVWTQNQNIFFYLAQRNWNPREPKGDKGVFRVQWGGLFDENFQAVFAEDFSGVCNFITMLRTDLELAYLTKDEKCSIGPE